MGMGEFEVGQVASGEVRKLRELSLVGNVIRSVRFVKLPLPWI